MKKVLLFGFNLFILMVMAQWAIAQMPAAISIEPANATGWDEITLTLDASKACVPDGKQPVTAASKVKMHSAAFLYDDIDNWQSAWGGYGVDYDADSKEETPRQPELTDLGDSKYSITFTPGEFYGVPEGSTIIGITAVFNGNSWDFEAKDNATDGCGDFYIPLSYDPPTPALKFKLDLTYQEELGNFDRATGKAYVIVNETEYEMDQLLIGILPDARYEKTLTEADDGITAGTKYTYKFKMDETVETVERDTIVAKDYQIFKSHFFNNEEKPVAMGEIKFSVDMRYAARAGKFDSAVNYVDIAGSLNGWNGKDHHLTPVGDSIYEITVDSLDLEQIIEYKFRMDGSWADDSSEFPAGGPARHATVIKGHRDAKSVWNNDIPGSVPVTLSVNMKNEILKGTFVPKQNYVDVAGTMTGWGTYNDELFDKDGDSIYVTHPAVVAPISGIAAGDTMEYKYRIDSDWDNSEFPGGQPNRKYPVKDTVGGVENIPDMVWYNDTPLAIESQQIRIQEVTFYPNPVSDVMYIENEVGMNEIRIINLLGQQVVHMRLDKRTSYNLNTSNLDKGIYILTVYGEKGYKGVAKFIKQ